MKKKRFVTLFPLAENKELTKDVGMIPYLLQKNYNYNSYVACYKNGDYPSLDSSVKGLKLKFIKKYFNNICIDGFLFIMKEAVKIDYLNIYHIGMKRLVMWVMVFKLLNPDGILYLKLDMDLKGRDKLKQEGCIKRYIRKKIFSYIDIISAESSCVCNDLEKIYNRKIFYIPNGYYNWDKVVPQDKDKIILSVGRLGTFQKATDILLEAFAKTAMQHNYRLRLIGNISKEFSPFIKDYFKRYPNLLERIEFLGSLENKTVLQEEYERASIFVLPSRWESFGIVIAEAVAAGNYLILSEGVAPCDDFVISDKYGQLFCIDDVIELSNKILMAIDSVESIDGIFDKIRKHAMEHFEWNGIINRLYFLLEDL